MNRFFRSVHFNEFDRASALQSLERDGYLVIRSAVPVEEINALLGLICQVLGDHGWIDQRSSLDRIAKPERVCADPDESFKSAYDRVFALEALHRFPHLSCFTQIMKALVGDDLLVHPKHAARLVFPNHEPGRIRAHQDHTAVQGDHRCFTAWVPLHDCPIASGPLAVLPGSHANGVQVTAEGSGYIPLTAGMENEWVSGDLHAGDVLLFNSLTVHEALPNTSDALRISLDFRFQSLQHKVNPGVFVFAGSGRSSWEKVYADWKSKDLQYYWKALPLKLSPTLEELRALSVEAESPAMRTRYGNIRERFLQQVEQSPCSPLAPLVSRRSAHSP